MPLVSTQSSNWNFRNTKLTFQKSAVLQPYVPILQILEVDSINMYIFKNGQF